MSPVRPRSPAPKKPCLRYTSPTIQRAAIIRIAHLEARYPSGKGEVCKTFMRRFDPDPRLQNLQQKALPPEGFFGDGSRSYSARSASIGFSLEALRAGNHTASIAVSVRIIGTAINATGSHHFTPNRKLAIR